MPSDSKRTCSFTMPSVEEKEALIAYARARGYTRLSDFLRVTTIEYIRRRPPKEPSVLDKYTQN